MHHASSDRPGLRLAPLHLLTLLLLAAGPAAGQGASTESAVTRASRLVEDALLLAGRGDTAAALEYLERATRLAPGLAEAHYRRGQILARQAGSGLGDMFKRRTAGAHLERAIQIDRGNPYYYLELGRLRMKQGLLRVAAGPLFRRALETAEERGDPAVTAEVHAELADIHFRRWQASGHRRLITGSGLQFDPELAMGDEHYTRDFLSQSSSEVPDAGELDLRQAEASYRAGFAAWPAHDASAAGLLTILYDGNRLEEYLEIARQFVRAAPENARAHLFWGLGLWRSHRVREASRAFERAVALMTPAERARLTDLSVIMRAAEARSYQGLTSAQREEFNRIYWSANDPLKLTPENEHLLEHLARVAYADMRFSAPELHLRGWETDRGVIYIRYGPPPVVATFPPGTDQIGDDPSMLGKITTVWYYPERNLRFVFHGPPGYNFARFAGDFVAYVEDARYQMPVKYDNVPVDEALDSIPVQAVAFRPRAGADTLGTELVLFAGIPLKEMATGVDLDQGPLQTGVFVTDRYERDMHVSRRAETVRFDAEGQFENRTFVTHLPPGEYRYRVEARQPTTQRAARGAALLTLEGFDRPSLTLSDVLLADRVAPRDEDATAGDRSDFFIDPNPQMAFAPGERLHLYWELYNLTPDSTGTARYRAEIVLRVQSLERTGIAAQIVGGVLDAMGATARGDDQVSVSYEVSEGLAGRDRVPAWVALDLAEAPRGSYLLELVITDLVSGQVATRQRIFTVTDRDS